MSGRALTLLLLVAALVCAGCRKKAAVTHDASPVTSSLVVLASLPLEHALSGQARFEYARSPGIARKLDADHPDVVIADSVSVDRLVSTGRLDPATRRALVVDRLVIVAQPGSPIPLGKPEELARLAADEPPWRGRLALLDPQSWPEGELTRSTLQTLHVDEQIRDRLQPEASVEELLRAVEDHKRMLGVLGHSAAVALGARVHVVCDLGPAVAYEAAFVKASPHRDAALRYIADLASDAGLRAFEERGFTRSPRGK